MRTLPLLVLLLVVTSDAHPQTPIPTTWSPELAAADPTTEAGGGGRRPTVASDGRNFLVVSSQFNFYSQIHYAMLVDAEGNALLPASIAFNGLGDVLSVASSGRTYLMTWGAHGGTSAVRISASGRVLDERPLRVRASTRGNLTPHDIGGRSAVAWSGSTYVVLTRNEPFQGQTSLVATRVDEDARIVQDDIPLGAGGWVFDIAARNDVSVVATTGPGGLQVFTLNGGVASQPVKVAEGANEVAVAAGDDGFMVVWSTATGITTGSVFAQHFDQGGHIDANSFEVGTALQGLDLSWAGDRYLAAWTSAYGIETAGLIASGVRAVLVPATGPRSPALAFNGTSTLLAFEGEAGIHAKRARVGAPERLVHRLARNQGYPKVVFGHDEPVIAWFDHGIFARSLSGTTEKIAHGGGEFAYAPGDDSDVVVWNDGARLLARVIGKDPVLLSENGALPAAIWTGSAFVVVWTEAPRIRTATLSEDGVLAIAPRVVAETTGRVALASSRFQVLAVWKSNDLHMRGALISSDSIVETEIIALPEDLAQSWSVASDGEDFWVTWISQSGAKNDFIMGRRIGSDGRAIGTPAIYSTGGDFKSASQVFWTGTNYLAVWTNRPEENGVSKLWALRIEPDGRLIDFPAQPLGAVAGGVTSWAWADGQLALAYVRSDGSPTARAYFRVTVTPRERAIRTR